MAHFAEIDENNIVKRVVRVPNLQEARGQEYLAVDLNLGGTWIQCSYSGSIRKNFPSKGYKYLEVEDVFIPPCPFQSWSLNSNCEWKAPVSKPTDGKIYVWNESKIAWEESSE
jgi:hypothetical protein